MECNTKALHHAMKNRIMTACEWEMESIEIRNSSILTIRKKLTSSLSSVIEPIDFFEASSLGSRILGDSEAIEKDVVSSLGNG